MLIAIVLIDVVSVSLVPAEANYCLAEYFMNGLIILVPGICLLITGLIYRELLIEV